MFVKKLKIGAYETYSSRDAQVVLVAKQYLPMPSSWTEADLPTAVMPTVCDTRHVLNYG